MPSHKLSMNRVSPIPATAASILAKSEVPQQDHQPAPMTAGSICSTTQKPGLEWLPKTITDGDKILVYYGYSLGWGTDTVEFSSQRSGDGRNRQRHRRLYRHPGCQCYLTDTQDALNTFYIHDKFRRRRHPLFCPIRYLLHSAH
jgi:hypothetical protein